MSVRVAEIVLNRLTLFCAQENVLWRRVLFTANASRRRRRQRTRHRARCWMLHAYQRALTGL